MALSSSAIIDLATPLSVRDSPARIRARLEWSWGLGHGRLDDHLLEFDDPQAMLMDETILVFPHSDIIRQLYFHDDSTRQCVLRTHIRELYNGLKTFEYVVVPTDLESPPALRILTSELPPHLVLCTTYGKMLKAWGKLPRKVWDGNRASLVKRVKRAQAVPHNGRPEMAQLTQIQQLHRNWTWAQDVPPSFLSPDSHGTIVKPEENHTTGKRSSTKRDVDFQACSSSGSRYEPKRRISPSEIESPPLYVTQVLGLGNAAEEDDDVISHDSYISGVEGDPEEFVKASVARGDYHLDAKCLKRIRRWAKRASRAGIDETLFNNEQIDDDPREQPRDAASVDMAKPDYLLRDTGRMVI
ncbi:hypothetical protein K438DRAFT_1988453 [Mycena galopus ATCC 62051]|nr:hypothetical protein K438DRAFT_1988453 [Mycena galopus ATCC 62051]